MKLKVEGIEEIEITDPAGLCDPPAPQLPSPMPPLPRGIPALPPAVNPFRPQPGAPIPFGDPNLPGNPGIRPIGPGIYTRPTIPGDEVTKWGVGGEAIQQAGQNLDKEKWGKNWQSKNNGAEGQGDGNGNSHETG